MLRASRMFKRWESKIAINYAALALGRCIFGVVVMSHWFACLFALQARARAPPSSRGPPPTAPTHPPHPFTHPPTRE